MTETEATVGEMMLTRARAAAPVLAEHAAYADEELRLAPESIKALREVGVFEINTPKRFGGPDLSTAETARVLIELGRADPAAAWLAGVCAEGKLLVDPLISSETGAEVFADPGVRICGVGLPPGQAERVPGGLRVSGRWSYASGCEDASWAGTSVMPDGGPFTMVVMPMGDLEIDRTWDTVGLRGTGSHTLVAREVFVPVARVLEMPTLPNGFPDMGAGRPLFVFVNDVLLLAPMVGAARGALDTVEAIMPTRKPPMMAYDSLADTPSARNLFAQAAHLVETAERGVLSLAARIDQHWPGTGLPARELAGMRMEEITTVNQCRTAVDMLLDLHGSSGLAKASPLQRYWRDLHMGTRHMRFTSYRELENYGNLVTRKPDATPAD